ncbi:hypothetical protein KIPB_007589 [Kipferlia bialata]|uniref:Uncharacterized protein n=1 Tax=Kipferlia bialata TaxID=797122 RepID=A0A9K3D094_9EUKA|nr:hypothetical protein KIPB_007589 [Kipferlia bialata]|eukprot:g7589.t1
MHTQQCDPSGSAPTPHLSASEYIHSLSGMLAQRRSEASRERAALLDARLSEIHTYQTESDALLTAFTDTEGALDKAEGDGEGEGGVAGRESAAIAYTEVCREMEETQATLATVLAIQSLDAPAPGASPTPSLSLVYTDHLAGVRQRQTVLRRLSAHPLFGVSQLLEHIGQGLSHAMEQGLTALRHLLSGVDVLETREEGEGEGEGEGETGCDAAIRAAVSLLLMYREGVYTYTETDTAGCGGGEDGICVYPSPAPSHPVSILLDTARRHALKEFTGFIEDRCVPLWDAPPRQSHPTRTHTPGVITGHSLLRHVSDMCAYLQGAEASVTARLEAVLPDRVWVEGDGGERVPLRQYALEQVLSGVLSACGSHYQWVLSSYLGQGQGPSHTSPSPSATGASTNGSAMQTHTHTHAHAPRHSLEAQLAQESGIECLVLVIQLLTALSSVGTETRSPQTQARQLEGVGTLQAPVYDVPPILLQYLEHDAETEGAGEEEEREVVTTTDDTPTPPACMSVCSAVYADCADRSVQTLGTVLDRRLQLAQSACVGDGLPASLRPSGGSLSPAVEREVHMLGGVCDTVTLPGTETGTGTGGVGHSIMDTVVGKLALYVCALNDLSCGSASTMDTAASRLRGALNIDRAVSRVYRAHAHPLPPVPVQGLPNGTIATVAQRPDTVTGAYLSGARSGLVMAVSGIVIHQGLLGSVPGLPATSQAWQSGVETVGRLYPPGPERHALLTEIQGLVLGAVQELQARGDREEGEGEGDGDGEVSGDGDEDVLESVRGVLPIE